MCVDTDLTLKMIRKFEKLGKKIREFRVKNNKNVTEAAKELLLSRSFLSKLENGHFKPTLDLLKKIINYYSIPNDQSQEIYNLAGYASSESGVLLMETKYREEVSELEENQVTGQVSEKMLKVNIPGDIKIFYTDSAFVTTNEFGLVIDFGQRLGSTNEQTIVSRVGMSKSHALALIKVLQERLEEKKPIEATKRVES